MPVKINNTTKSLVIQKWLAGNSRDEIALECGLSGGAVSATVARWKQSMGVDYTDQLRELAVALKKGGFSSLELAGAVRLRNTLDQLGIDEESLMGFVTDVYNTCKEIGLQPHQIAACLGDLVTFFTIDGRIGMKKETRSSRRTTATEHATEGAGQQEEKEEEVEREEEGNYYRYHIKNAVPLISQLPAYLADLKEEKIGLQYDIEKLRREKNLIESEKKSFEREKDEMLKKHNMTEEQLTWYDGVKAELRKSDLSIDDIPEFVKSVQWIQESGHNLGAIVHNFSSYAELMESSHNLEQDIFQMERRKNELEHDIFTLEGLAEKHRLRGIEIDALQEMGFGFKEIRRLRYAIAEIVEENKGLLVGSSITNSKSEKNSYVVNKFLDDIDNDYDKIFGFQPKIDQLNNAIKNQSDTRTLLYQSLKSLSQVWASITALLQKGVKEDEIASILALLATRPDLIDSIRKIGIGGSEGETKSETRMSENNTERGKMGHLDLPPSRDEPNSRHPDLPSNSSEITLPIVSVVANGNIDGKLPINTIDHSFDTWWLNKGIGSWLLLDLGTKQRIRSVKIAWYRGDIYDYYYDISLSDDASNFVDVKTGTSGGYSASFMEYMLGQNSLGRYVRITVVRNNINDQAGITEVEVTGWQLL